MVIFLKRMSFSAQKCHFLLRILKYFNSELYYRKQENCIVGKTYDMYGYTDHKQRVFILRVW